MVAFSSKSGRSRLREVPLTRGSKYSDLTWKLLVFWKTGRLREVVATGGSTVCREENNTNSIKPLRVSSSVATRVLLKKETKSVGAT